MLRSTKDFETFQEMTMAARPVMEYLEQDDAFRLYQPGFRRAQVSLCGRRVQVKFSYIGMGGWGTQGHDEHWLVIQAVKQGDGWLLSHRLGVSKIGNEGRSARRYFTLWRVEKGPD